MADERYEWLDKETAERLLRAEPVEILDEPARTQLARLTVALRHAAHPEAPAHPDDGEMPGEAVATAAYRRARSESAAGADHHFGMVRVVPPPKPSAISRLLRPVRFGVVAVLAAGAFGGVAVGATAGLLPSPFDPGSAPATSVSGAPTGKPSLHESPGTRMEQPSRRAPASGSPTTAPPPGRGVPMPPSPSAVPGADQTEPGSGAKVTEPAAGKGGKNRKTVTACRDHQAGTHNEKQLKRLERAAKGVPVDQFCAGVLSGTTPGNGHGGGPGRGPHSGQGNSAGQGGSAGPGAQNGQGGAGLGGNQGYQGGQIAPVPGAAHGGGTGQGQDKPEKDGKKPKKTKTPKPPKSQPIH